MTEPRSTQRASESIQTTREVCWDRVVGSTADLLAAGVVTPEQIPGNHGLGKRMATFYGSDRKRKGDPRPINSEWKQVRLLGRARLEVLVGISEAEYEKRLRTSEQERQQRQAQARERERAKAGEEQHAYRSNPESLRENVTFLLDHLERRICEHTPGWGSPTKQSYLSRFPHVHDESMQGGLAALEDLRTWLRAVPISSAHPECREPAPTVRRAGHLRLVHSA